MNAVRGLLEAGGLVVDEPNVDFGIDAVVHLPGSAEGLEGRVVALQIKSGRSYRRRLGYGIRCNPNRLALWRRSSFWFFGFVYDPTDQLLRWTDLTGWALRLGSSTAVSHCPVPGDRVLTASTLNRWIDYARDRAALLVSHPVEPAQVRAWMTATDVPSLLETAIRVRESGGEALRRTAREARRDADGLYSIGRQLELAGRFQQAIVLFRRAATRGSVLGMNTFGIRLRQSGRHQAAVPFLESAVEGGDAMAAHTLARIFDDGRDTANAIQLERFAAASGDVRAKYDLGRILTGRGDVEEGLAWLRRAARDGDEDAAGAVSTLQA